jgi:hypothetical protein
MAQPQQEDLAPGLMIPKFKTRSEELFSAMRFLIPLVAQAASHAFLVVRYRTPERLDDVRNRINKLTCDFIRSLEDDEQGASKSTNTAMMCAMEVIHEILNVNEFVVRIVVKPI